MTNNPDEQVDVRLMTAYGLHVEREQDHRFDGCCAKTAAKCPIGKTDLGQERLKW